MIEVKWTILTVVAGDIGQGDHEIADFVLFSEVDDPPRISSVIVGARVCSRATVNSEVCCLAIKVTYLNCFLFVRQAALCKTYIHNQLRFRSHFEEGLGEKIRIYSLNFYHAIKNELVINGTSTNHYFTAKLVLRRGSNNENNSSYFLEPINDCSRTKVESRG